MGGSQSSFASELLIAGIAVAGSAAVYHYYTTSNTKPSPSSTPASTSSKSKKGKKTASDSEFDKAIAAVRAREEAEAKAKADARPKVVPFPAVVPGTFGDVESIRQESEADDDAGAQLSKSKAAKRKRKGKKPTDSLAASSSSIPATVPTIPSKPTPDTQSDARSAPTAKLDAKKKAKKVTPPPPIQAQPSPTYHESDVPSSNDAWTRVEQLPGGSAAQISRTPTTTTEMSSVQSASEMPDNVIGLQRTGGSASTTVKRKTLAEKLLPKPRKTGVEE